MKKTFSIEAIHHLYAGELGQVMTQLEDVDKRYKAQMDENDPTGDNSLNGKPYDIIDGIAVYKISGPLISSGSWWSRFLGYAAYDDIRADLTMAASDPAVNEILLFMGTPGGTVSGLTDASEAIRKVAAAKPTYVYSSKNVASGGYWLASNAGMLIGSPESEWGSIGVIVTHFSYQKQLENDGIGVTIIKSDDLKAVGGPYKDLTDKEISHIQDQVGQFNDLFQEQVQKQRPNVRLSTMHGETYIGQEALNKGLIDAVMTYDQTIDFIKSKRTTQTQTGGYHMKMTAEELKAALEGGATLDSLGLSEDEAAEIEASAQKSESEVEESEVTTEELPEIGVIQEQLVAAQAQIGEITAKLADAEARLAAAQTDIKLTAEMRAIVAEVVGTRRVALRFPKVDMSDFSAETLVADYKAITKQFNEAYVTGGIFKKKEEVKTPIAQDSIHARQLDAAA